MHTSAALVLGYTRIEIHCELKGDQMDTNTLIVNSIICKPGSFSLLCDWHFFLFYASRRFLFFSSLCSSVIVISRRFLFFSSLCSSVIDAARNLSRSLLSRRPSWVLFRGSICFRTNPKTASGTCKKPKNSEKDSSLGFRLMKQMVAYTTYQFVVM